MAHVRSTIREPWIVVLLGMSVVAGGCGGGGSKMLSTDGGGSDVKLDVTPDFAPDAASPVDGAADLAAEVAAEAAPSEVPQARGLFVSPAGLDTAPGTMAEPLKTIGRAVQLAQVGDTITLLDGTYDATSEPALGGNPAFDPSCGQGSGVNVPAGITIQAATPGMARVAVSGAHGLCLRGSKVKGIAFSHTGSGGGRMVEVLWGENEVEGATFTGAYCSGGGGYESAIQVDGEAKLTLRAGGVVNYLGGGCSFLAVYRLGEATIIGGKVSGGSATGASDSGLLRVGDQSRLVLDGVTLESTMHQHGVTLIGQGSLITKAGSALRGFRTACVPESAVAQSGGST